MRHKAGRTQLRSASPDRPTVEYQTELASLRPLAQQGDGMVLMIGAPIPTVAATILVVLLDEPEASLHPPQAYQMGKALADPTG